MPDNLEDIPQHNELMWPTLKAIKALGGSAHISEILSKVAEIENFSEETQSIPHVNGNGTRLGYRLAWARTFLKRGGALINSERGVWSITDKGEKLSANDLPRIFKEIKAEDKLLRDLSGFNIHSRSGSSPENEDDDSEEENWKTQLLNTLQAITPDAFERLTQRILRESGFTTVEVTGRSGDGGIDGTGILQLNLITFPVAFQCKRYKGSVGSPAIRDFRGGIAGRFEKGLLITTGSFSSQAIQESRRAGALAIDLVDGTRLCDLLKSLSLGVSTEMVENVVVNAEWFSSI
jgi:restriction system protein